MANNLNLKGEYFHAIRAGKKVEEYRLYNEYWRKRLEGREYERLIIKLGYPASHEAHRIINLSYFGYEVKTITHPLFGPDPVKELDVKVGGAMKKAGLSISRVLCGDESEIRIEIKFSTGKEIILYTTPENLTLALTGKSETPCDVRLRNIEIKEIGVVRNEK